MIDALCSNQVAMIVPFPSRANPASWLVGSVGTILVGTKMITDIPALADFERSGKSFLNLAWDSACKLFHDFDESGIEEWDQWGDRQREFWNAAQAPLSTSLALAQQGIEQLLKARIASVSPFLLIAASPRDWPQGCNKADVAFADFRTIDAQDLIRVHDTALSPRLPEEFKQRFEQMRRLRNSIFHTVDKRITVAASHVLQVTLEACAALLLNDAWPKLRREYLSNNSDAAAYGSDYVTYTLNRELAIVVDLFPPNFLFKYLAFNKRQRQYICYSCMIDGRDVPDYEPRLAVLRPNSATSTTLYCIACDQTTQVRRNKCKHEGCKGNVIETEDDTCCTCGENQ